MKKIKNQKPARRRGKASSMPGQLWPMWLAHVHKHGTCWLHACLLLTHVLCLRVTEALKLRACHFNFKTRTVLIEALKGQEPVNKPLISAVLPLLQHLRSKGLRKKRTRARGALPKDAFEDVWKFPKTGNAFLFPASRKDSKQAHRCKNTVCKAIQRLRKSFHIPTGVWIDIGKIRSHSGRQKMVQDLKLASVPEEIAMMYARIADVRPDHERTQ